MCRRLEGSPTQEGLLSCLWLAVVAVAPTRILWLLMEISIWYLDLLSYTESVQFLVADECLHLAYRPRELCTAHDIAFLHLGMVEGVHMILPCYKGRRTIQVSMLSTRGHADSCACWLSVLTVVLHALLIRVKCAWCMLLRV